mmetsp:Transcript_26307/g.63360  ORF Transcript_26307/g.63360 Transcript_26307/m.63360 type:complete len:683 (+) Transcript_26307:363-2411(+)
MGEGQSPLSQVGRSVRDSTQHVLDGLNQLVDDNLANLKLFLVVSICSASLLDSDVSLGLLSLGARLVLQVEDDGLRDQDPRNSQGGQDHQLGLNRRLSIIQGHWILLAQPHADQCVDQHRRLVHRSDPLVQNHVIHISEEAHHEDEHGNALAYQVDPPMGPDVIERVRESEHQPNQHLQDTENHGHLHLERVYEQKLIGRTDPGWVQSKRIRPGTAIVGDVVVSLIILGVANLLPPGAKHVESDAKEIVVNKPVVDREESHEQEQEASFVHRGLGVLQCVAVVEHEASCNEQATAVPNISVHHAKDERESYHCEQSRVSLLVNSHPVRLHQLLESPRVLVALDVRRRVLSSALVDDEHGRCSTPAGLVGQQLLDGRCLLLRKPDVGSEGDAALKHVHCGVQRLLLEDKQTPLLKSRVAGVAELLNHVVQLALEQSLKALQGCVFVVDVRLQRLDPLAGGPLGGRPSVCADTERLADPVDLLVHGAGGGSLEVDDKDALGSGLASSRISHGFWDLLKVCEGVSTRRAKQSAGETFLVTPSHNSGNLAEDHPIVEAVAEECFRRSTRKLPQSFLGGLVHELLLNCCSLLLRECIVVGLEIDELTVQLSKRLLNSIQSHVRLVGQKIIQSIAGDGVPRRGSNTLRKEPHNAIHFIQALDVSAVRPGKRRVVHILNLNVAMVPQLV